MKRHLILPLLLLLSLPLMLVAGPSTIRQVSFTGNRHVTSQRLLLMMKSRPDTELNQEFLRDDLRRLATWIDMNAVFYGAYSPDDQARQLRGERIEMPEVQ